MVNDENTDFSTQQTAKDIMFLLYFKGWKSRFKLYICIKLTPKKVNMFNLSK